MFNILTYRKWILAKQTIHSETSWGNRRNGRTNKLFVSTQIKRVKQLFILSYSKKGSLQFIWEMLQFIYCLLLICQIVILWQVVYNLFCYNCIKTNNMATDINQYLSESIETHKMKHIQGSWCLSSKSGWSKKQIGDSLWV